jgi:uncharacterized protein YjeT (DUF2065 family)
MKGGAAGAAGGDLSMGHIAFADLFIGVGFVLVVEGLLFAAMPQWMRNAMTQALATPDQVLRTVGLVSAVIGLLLIWVVR